MRGTFAREAANETALLAARVPAAAAFPASAALAAAPVGAAARFAVPWAPFLVLRAALLAPADALRAEPRAPVVCRARPDDFPLARALVLRPLAVEFVLRRLLALELRAPAPRRAEDFFACAISRPSFASLPVESLPIAGVG
jgi:hypothetical protein